MSGHRPERTFHENGERNVCELDRYADKSYLGIHYWDLCWKVAYPKLKKNWNSNVQTWETVQIWGDCPMCAVVYDYVLVSQTDCDCFMNFYSRFYIYLHSRSCIQIYLHIYLSAFYWKTVNHPDLIMGNLFVISNFVSRHNLIKSLLGKKGEIV